MRKFSGLFLHACAALLVAGLSIASSAMAAPNAEPGKAKTAPKAQTPKAHPPKANVPKAAVHGDFSSFIATLWPDAEKQGVSRKTFDLAFKGVTPDASIIALTKKQSEFVKPIWSYLDSAVSASRLARGQAAAEQYASLLASLERKYGVDRRAVLGIWGMETNFGSYTGDKDVIRALATLAWKRYRDNFFRDELLVALRILEEGHVERAAMRGSWAGAMGQTQFMPSSFMKYAVDGDGDGARDIWTTVPDALASTANYLASFGWESGVPWGIEVELPEGFDLKSAMTPRDFSQWSDAGLTRADGGSWPRKGKASLFLPAGIHGPALLITENFRVIKKYNSSDAYALGVAHLGDRLLGGSALQASWPRNEKRLGLEEVKEIQRRLAAMGMPVGKIDGRIGEQSRDSVKKAQIKHGLPPDGYPTLALLQRMRQNP
ncbi:MAG: lytic transglycosylase [Rhizobiales bacterium PAR1]|nr:MAG: lytic transglycosylase [Rhizobiales bacterium PAR1]